MIKRIIRSSLFCWGLFLFLCVEIVEANNQKVASLNLLNKTSAKKHPITIPIGYAYVIQDIRIVPRSCKVAKDPVYKTKTSTAEIDVYMEQDFEGNREEATPILLYKGTISNNPRIPSSPLEHPLYDLILVGCSESHLTEEISLSAK